jgi:hypothetical protein
MRVKENSTVEAGKLTLVEATEGKLTGATEEG